MKLLASAAAVVCLALAATAAAPALSLSPWRPEPVDFELAPGKDAILARAGTAVMSRPLRPGNRFNLVGMRWRGTVRPVVTLRSRVSGGRWSRWAKVSEEDDRPDAGRGEPAAEQVSMPAWVGEADEVQYRLSRPVAGLRIHFVNVRGTTTAADRLRTVLRHAANGAIASVAGLFRSRAADAAEPQPGMVSREGWGAEDCPPRAPPDYGVVKAAFIHHTVSTNDYTREEAPSIVLAICRYHRNSNGWNDIGYNFLVDKYGTLYEGRAGGVDQPVVGAQAQGYNAQSTGIANIGDYTSVEQTPEALSAIARLVRWKLPLHGVPTSGSTTLVSAGGSTNKYPAGAQVRVQRVSGHRDVDATECPGDALYSQLPALRRMIGSLPPAGTGTSLRASLSRRAIRFKRSALLSGALTSIDGGPLAAETVRVQVRRARRWRTLRVLTTGPGGAFSLPLRPRVNRTVRARFSGRGDLLPASSPWLRLLVRPLVSLIDPPAQGTKGERVRIRGRVAPRKRRLLQVLQLRRHGRWIRVGLRKLTARRGRFRGSFVPAVAGSFRYYVSSRPDRSNARGRSARVEIEVVR